MSWPIEPAHLYTPWVHPLALETRRAEEAPQVPVDLPTEVLS